jgi:hypothetical protein
MSPQYRPSPSPPLDLERILQESTFTGWEKNVPALAKTPAKRPQSINAPPFERITPPASPPPAKRPRVDACTDEEPMIFPGSTPRAERSSSIICGPPSERGLCSPAGHEGGDVVGRSDGELRREAEAMAAILIDNTGERKPYLTTLLKEAKPSISAKVRYNTFVTRPLSARADMPTVKEMVKAGFHRSPSTRQNFRKHDAVSCHWCGNEFSVFAGRDPAQKHANESPDCAFVRMFISKNQHNLTTNVNPGDRLDSSFYMARRFSFEGWPSGVGFSAETMAERGFLYSGKGDQLMCLFGCCKLSNWFFDDDIERRHKQVNPECPVVKILYC